MDIRHKLFPYPVLSLFSDDYISSEFISEARPVKNLNEIVLFLNVSIDNEGLKDLVEKEYAEYIFHIECSYTSYRSIVRTKETKNTIRIPESKLNGKVSICSFILAKENLNNYTNSDFNPDYNNRSFNIDKGSILAIGSQTNIEITKEVEELSKVPSVFSILRRDTDDSIGLQVDIDGDKIKLWLSNREFYHYTNAVNVPSFQPVLHSMLILPALIFTFETLKSGGTSRIEDYESYRWFKAIKKKLKHSDIDFNVETIENLTSFELAQRILDLPINRALASLTSIGLEEDDE
jgi:hypothetical protein